MKKCIVIGTGLIGQQFIRLLEDHPYFELVDVVSSNNSVGQTLEQKWDLPEFAIPESFAQMRISSIDDFAEKDYEVVFSALPTITAQDLEISLAKSGIHVFSNSSAHRYDDDVPILIPEINANHLNLITQQKPYHEHGGFIITNSNCTTSGITLVLHELSKLYSIKNVFISSYQALSGAGFEGLKTLPRDRVIPFIENEENKIEIETRKILGQVSNSQIVQNSTITNILANCARVPVIDGHLIALTIELNEIPNTVELENYFERIIDPFHDLPTAPGKHIILHNEIDRPQSTLDCLAGGSYRSSGMAVSIGRIRYSKNYIRLFALVHNTIRGGAGGSLLNAELCYTRGLL